MKSQIPVRLYPSLDLGNKYDQWIAGLIACPNVEHIHRTEGMMHNKFTLVDRNVPDSAMLMTGSFNYTITAAEQNRENVIVTNDAYLVGEYGKEFDSIWDLPI